MKLLVTGATGFIGRRLCQKLLDSGYSLRVLVRDASRFDVKNGVEIVVGDITHPETLCGCCEGIDVVFNLAAFMGHHEPPSETAFARSRKINVEGLKNVLSEAKRSRVGRFIHLSSTAAMGLLKDKLVDENTPCKPYTPYQVTKYEGEQLLLKEYQENGFPVMILRPSMIYGPGFKGDFLTLAKVCKTGFFPTIGKGKNLSPALFIDDLIDVLPNCIEKGRTGQIYLLTSEQSYPLQQASEIIGKALGKKLHYIYVPVLAMIFGAFLLEKGMPIIGLTTPVTRSNIKSTVTDRIFDVSKAKKELNFKQKVTLEDGLTKTVHYFKEMNYL